MDLMAYLVSKSWDRPSPSMLEKKLCC